MRALIAAAAISVALSILGERASAQTAPPASDVTGTGDLSDKLKATGGVVHPRADSDTIDKAPQATGPMPVIPPPGTPQREPDVKPQ